MPAHTVLHVTHYTTYTLHIHHIYTTCATTHHMHTTTHHMHTTRARTCAAMLASACCRCAGHLPARFIPLFWIRGAMGAIVARACACVTFRLQQAQEFTHHASETTHTACVTVSHVHLCRMCHCCVCGVCVVYVWCVTSRRVYTCKRLHRCRSLRMCGAYVVHVWCTCARAHAMCLHV